jgi:hypothetical protein
MHLFFDFQKNTSNDIEIRQHLVSIAKDHIHVDGNVLARDLVNGTKFSWNQIPLLKLQVWIDVHYLATNGPEELRKDIAESLAKYDTESAREAQEQRLEQILFYESMVELLESPEKRSIMRSSLKQARGTEIQSWIF